MGGDFYQYLFSAKGIRAKDSRHLATLIFPNSADNIPGFGFMLTLARFTTLVATGMSEPGLMPFALGLSKEGRDWLANQFPAVIFESNHIEAHAAGSLAEAFGILSVQGESRGVFDLVGFRGKTHTLQLLCQHGYPLAFRFCSPTDQITFGGKRISDLISEFQRPQKVIGEGGYGRFLTPEAWKKYASFVEAAVRAVGIEAPIAVMGHSRITSPDWLFTIPESLRHQVVRLENLVGLAETTYRPALQAMRQTRGFRRTDPLRVNWRPWIPSETTPRIRFLNFDFPARERLQAQATITAFLARGGMTWSDVEAWLTPRQKRAFAARFHDTCLMADC